MTAGGYELIQVEEPTPEAFTQALAEAGLSWPHEDILEHHRHPGVRFADGLVGLVLHSVVFDRKDDKVDVAQAAAVLGDDCGVIARWKGDALDEVLSEPHAARADLICAVVEALHDNSSDAITDLEERVDDIELDVLGAEGRREIATTIHDLERELVTLRRAITPMVEALDKLGRKIVDAPLAFDAWRVRYSRLVSQMDDVDGLLTSILDVNLTLVSVRQNEDMRKIAAWGAIGIAPTAMAGIWGMNFENMPELTWEIGYPLALGLIFGVCIGLYRFFRKAGWL